MEQLLFMVLHLKDTWKEIIRYGGKSMKAAAEKTRSEERVPTQKGEELLNMINSKKKVLLSPVPILSPQVQIVNGIIK
jgi:hypothetical protein